MAKKGRRAGKKGRRSQDQRPLHAEAAVIMSTFNSFSKKRAKPKKELRRRKKNRWQSKKFEDPLEVQLPPRWLRGDKCRKILALRKLQYRLWGWCVALAILLLVSITAIDVASDFNFIPAHSVPYNAALLNGEVFAVFIIVLELSHGFTQAKNKALYLKQNWIAILAILPLGMLLRVARSFEGFAILEHFASLRTLQAATKLGELNWIAPTLEIPYEIEILILEPLATGAAPLFAALSSAPAAIPSAIGGLVRSGAALLKFLR
ncbi:MAG: hypothetical protein V1822_00260 [Candidatus Micrarchaeota archaeon]